MKKDWQSRLSSINFRTSNNFWDLNLEWKIFFKIYHKLIRLIRDTLDFFRFFTKPFSRPIKTNISYSSHSTSIQNRLSKSFKKIWSKIQAKSSSIRTVHNQSKFFSYSWKRKCNLLTSTSMIIQNTLISTYNSSKY